MNPVEKTAVALTLVASSAFITSCKTVKALGDNATNLVKEKVEATCAGKDSVACKAGRGAAKTVGFVNDTTQAVSGAISSAKKGIDEAGANAINTAVDCARAESDVDTTTGKFKNCAAKTATGAGKSVKDTVENVGGNVQRLEIPGRNNN